MDSVGINKSFGSSSYDEPDDGDLTSTRDRFGKLWAFLVQEARAVSLWSLLSVFLRFTLVCLGMFVELRNDSSSREGLFGASKELLVTASVVVGWVLSLAPSKVLLLQAPGFIFANPWYATSSTRNEIPCQNLVVSTDLTTLLWLLEGYSCG